MIFKRLSLKQIKTTLLESERPTLKKNDLNYISLVEAFNERSKVVCNT